MLPCAAEAIRIYESHESRKRALANFAFTLKELERIHNLEKIHIQNLGEDVQG